MIKYIDSNTIDFIEYRESKKGIDMNFYMDMDTFSFFEIYERTSLEAEYIFEKLINLDKKLDILKRKKFLSKEDQLLYNECIELGQHYYSRYGFLDDKLRIMDMVKEKKDYNLLTESDLELDNINEDINLSEKDLLNLFIKIFDDLNKKL